MSRLKGGAAFACGLPPKGLSNFPGPGSPLELVLRRTLAVYDPAQTGSGVVPVSFYVRNPSPRLRLAVSIGWEMAGGVDFVAGVATPTWQLTVIRVPAQGGPIADLDVVFVDGSGNPLPRALPDGYEVETSAKDLRGDLVLHAGDGEDLASGLGGALVLEARWEPKDGCYCDDMWPLVQRADVFVPNGEPTIVPAGTT